ncbi:hypothetical protein evm_012225 [Chilo suppressalis]|nr:hypothetical protein evm_012225 [Chilo suppressalis]
MSTECVSIKQEVDIEIAPELVNIKEEVDTESLFIKQEPEDDVLSNTNAYSETTEIAPKFVNTQLEVEKEPLFVKQEPGLDVLSNTNEACETEEIVPEFVSVKQEIEIECSEFSAIEMEVVTDAHQHQQQLQQETQRNIQSPQTRPYSNAERQRRYREKRKADKMNFCTTFSQSSDDQTQQEQPQHDIQINKRQPLSSAERQRRYRKSLREKRQQQQQMGDVNAITVQQKVDPAVLERKRQLNKQRQSRFRARQRFEWSSTSSHQGQTERVQSNVSPREYKQEFWEEQEINQRNRENENLQQTVKSETNSDSEDLTSNNESVEHDNLESDSDQPPAKKAESHYDTPSSHHTQQSSQGSQNIIIETGHHQDQLNTRHTINVIVNNNKKERQKRYREQNRDRLKQREAERRKRIQYSQSMAGLSTSPNTDSTELNNKEIITAQSSFGLEEPQPSSIKRNEQVNELNAFQKKRERQQRYREQNRDKLRQREAERRRRLQNAEMITELSTSPNSEFT